MTTPVNSLNPILTQDFQKYYTFNLRKAKILKVASIINLIAICVFTAFLLSLLTVSSSTIPLVHMAIGITAPLIGALFSKLHASSKRCFKTADFYNKVLEEQKKIKNQSEAEIKTYLDKIKCKASNIKKVIPVISHFKALERQKKSYLDEIEKLKKTKTNDSNLKFTIQKQIHDINEKEILRTNLKLAEIHHIIENPTTQKSLSSFGILFILNFSKRQASILSGDDAYFVFNDRVQKEKKQKCLTSTQVEILDISDISHLIF